jgi:LemA protein
MKKIFAIGLIGVIVLLGFWAFGSYNSLVNLDVATETQWAQVETAYQRRADLIPNLVETVKGYADFEREVLTEVTEARAKASSINVDANDLDPAAIAQFQEAQQGLSGALSRLLVTVERYPELKANQNFLQLQSQLEGTENRIAVERRRFNETVGEYNRSIRVFPGRIVASMTGFTEKGFFEAAEGSEQAPQVSFD